MRAPMLALAGTCIAIGLAPIVFWPAVARVLDVWQPAWERSAPPSLATLGWAHLALALVAGGAAAWLWRRTRSSAPRRAPTWDCGYAAPSPRMQYTAGSFAAIITEWFAWILRPVRHEQRPEHAFPATAHFSTHTPEAVLTHAIEPAGDLVLRLSAAARRLQHGRLQAYLLYLLVGLTALAGIALMGESQ